MTRRVLACSALAAGLILSQLAVSRLAAADGGRITGRVKLTTHLKGAALPSNVYQPRAITRRGVEPAPEIRNVVVYLKGIVHDGAMPASHGVIRQERETFLPRVLPVTRGATVDFPNDDPFFHNVFSLSKAAEFNLGRYAQGKSKSRTFDKPGLVKVYCQIHSHMSATLLVLDHPYFVVPDLNGTFTLDAVPAGKYTIVGWHERVGERAVAVQVENGGTTSVELSLPIEDGR